MAFPNPRQRRLLPVFTESTNMRSPRDSGSLGQAWKRTETMARELGSVAQEVHQLQRQLDRLRRRGGAVDDGEEVDIVDCATGNTYRVKGTLIEAAP